MPRIIDVIDHVNVMDDEFVYREPQQGSGDWRFGSGNRFCVPARRYSAPEPHRRHRCDPGLHKLDLFHGYRTPEGQVIYVETDTIRDLSRCAVCGTGIKALPQQIVTCPKCKSEYYL